MGDIITFPLINDMEQEEYDIVVSRFAVVQNTPEWQSLINCIRRRGLKDVEIRSSEGDDLLIDLDIFEQGTNYDDYNY